MLPARHPLEARICGALAPRRVGHLQFDGLELDLDADLGPALLDELVDRQRQHLPGAAGRDRIVAFTGFFTE